MRFQPGAMPTQFEQSPAATARTASDNPAKLNPSKTKPPKPLTYHVVQANPYRHWLILLCVGAAFGCASNVIDAAWSFGILSQRVRGFPTRYMIRSAYPFISLATVAMTWVSVWLLTSEEPSLQAQRRIRASTLRLLVTSSFLISSAYVLRLLEDFGVQAWTGWFSWLLQSMDILVILLLWPHLLNIAARMELRGMHWRTLITFVGLLFTTVLAAVPQQSIMRELGMAPDVFRHFQNFRLAMQVLWSTLAALVLVRFALAFSIEARKEGDVLGNTGQGKL